MTLGAGLRFPGLFRRQDGALGVTETTDWPSERKEKPAVSRRAAVRETPTCLLRCDSRVSFQQGDVPHENTKVFGNPAFFSGQVFSFH